MSTTLVASEQQLTLADPPTHAVRLAAGEGYGGEPDVFFLRSDAVEGICGVLFVPRPGREKSWYMGKVAHVVRMDPERPATDCVFRTDVVEAHYCGQVLRSAVLRLFPLDSPGGEDGGVASVEFL